MRLRIAIIRMCALHALPKGIAMRWTIRRKEEIILALLERKITSARVKEQHGISDEELAAWMRDYEAHGSAGLRVYRSQQYNPRRPLKPFSEVNGYCLRKLRRRKSLTRPLQSAELDVGVSNRLVPGTAPVSWRFIHTRISGCSPAGSAADTIPARGRSAPVYNGFEAPGTGLPAGKIGRLSVQTFNMTVIGVVEASLQVEAETPDLAKAVATELFEEAFETAHRLGYTGSNGAPAPVRHNADGMVTVDMIACDARQIDVMIDREE
jgi:transposase-like protein